MNSKPERQTVEENGMIYGIKGSREIKQTEADDLLTTNGIDKVIMNGKE